MNRQTAQTVECSVLSRLLDRMGIDHACMYIRMYERWMGDGVEFHADSHTDRLARQARHGSIRGALGGRSTGAETDRLIVVITITIIVSSTEEF